MTSFSTVARCPEVRRFGTGAHAGNWQCLLQDPHPDQRHEFGVDAEVYGRNLAKQRPEWLAANLRDAQALLLNRQKRIDDLAAIAAQLAALAATGTPLSYTAGTWVRSNAPTAAVALDAAGVRWHDHVSLERP